MTVLMAATGTGNVALVEALVKAGAKVNAQHSSGLTALAYAESLQAAERRVLLRLSKGVVPQCPPDVRPFYRKANKARLARHTLIITILKQHGAINPGPPIAKVGR
jgi:ribulose-5-phosphate 4-epimerase/fuculose-1-phosphate aldolase